MFDDIAISDPLPFNDEMKELGLDKNNRTWQTKDLDCAMNLYYIQGGQLFEQEYKVVKWEQGDPNGESVMDKIGSLIRTDPYLKKLDFHGEINFYDYIGDVADKWDCWVEFKATFIHGKVEKIELVEFKKTDNAERKKRDAEFWQKIDQQNAIWYNKFIFNTKIWRKLENIWYRVWAKIADLATKIAMLPF